MITDQHNKVKDLFFEEAAVATREIKNPSIGGQGYVLLSIG
jgi:hypothetical protein